MLKFSAESLMPVDIGSTVRIPIHDVDRAKGVPRNVLAVVKNKDNDYYILDIQRKICYY